MVDFFQKIEDYTIPAAKMRMPHKPLIQVMPASLRKSENSPQDIERAQMLEAWLKRHRGHLNYTRLDRTELCVDGFPRSANSLLCRKIIETAGYTNRTLSHHIHKRHNIECAVLANIPTIVPVREPEACIKSYLVYTGGKFGGGMFQHYIEMLEFVILYKSAATVALFEEITSDYASIVKRANRMYGDILTLPTVSDTELNDNIANKVATESQHEEKKFYREGVPNKSRESLKQEYATFVRSHPQLSRCRSLYEKILQIAADQ